MAQDTSSQIVDLNLLNAKQIAKEFKATQKDIKSKEIAIKLGAIAKFNDLRYFTQGQCLSLFLETLAPKKKLLSYVSEALKWFIAQLMQQSKLQLSENLLVQSFALLVEEESSVDYFSGLTSLIESMVYREEIKKPKGKKGKEEPPPPENPEIIVLRQLALKCLYYIITPLNVLDSSSFINLQLSFSKIPGLPAILCSITQEYQSILNSDGISDNERVIATQNCYYAMRCIAFISKFNPAALPDFIQQESFHQSLNSMLKDKFLGISAMQYIRNQVVEFEHGDVSIINDNIVDSILEVCEDSVKSIGELAIVVDQSSSAGAKGGKDPKKDDKNKKGAAPVVETVDPFKDFDHIVIDPLRKTVVFLAVMASSFFSLGRRKPDIIKDSVVQKLSSAAGAYLVNSAIWEVVEVSNQAPYDESVSEMLIITAKMLGCFGQINANLRNTARCSGAVTLLQSLLLETKGSYARLMSAVAIDDETDDCIAAKKGLKRVQTLRRQAEKSLLHLISGHEEVPGLINEPVRWKSVLNQNVEVHNDLNNLGEKFLSNLLLIISTRDDCDLAGRGVRVLSSLVVGQEPNEISTFLVSNKIDVTFIKPIAEYLLVVIPKQLEKGSWDNKTSSTEQLDPTYLEGIYLSLAFLETSLHLSQENIKSFGTKSNLEALEKLLFQAGPRTDSKDSPETFVSVFDPRNYSWDLESGDLSAESHVLRPLLVDIVTTIVKADCKYRTSEESLPAAPCAPVPAIISPCEEAALLAITICADSCLSVLQVAIDWTQTSSGAFISIAVSETNNLLQPVRDSILKFFDSVGSSTLGLAGALDSVAAKGFGTNWNTSSLFSFQSLLMNESSDWNPSSVSWQRPLLFGAAINEGAVLFDLAQLRSQPIIWPFFVIAASIQSVLMDPAASPDSEDLSLIALQSVTKSLIFEPVNQPVLNDLLIASFLALGGGFSLIGLLGRFGHASSDSKSRFQALLEYILTRGKSRESFWLEWAASHKVEVQVDPKTGKPIAKKDDKAAAGQKKDAKGKDPKAPVAVPVVAEIAYNLESSEEFPDPNRGPSSSLWKRLLDLPGNCMHSWLDNGSLLIAAVQGQLSQLAVTLLNQDVDMNYQDSFGRNALMYSIFLRDSVVVEELLSRKAIVDSVDRCGVPTIHYALHALSEEQIDRLLPGHVSSPSQSSLYVLGCKSFLEQLIQSSSLDANVRDADGHSVLMSALGLGVVNIAIGGCAFSVMHQAYHDESLDRAEVLSTAVFLLDSGVDVSACSKAGLTPLHVAAARGDLNLVSTLLQRGAIANAIDFSGYHSIHYLFATCPSQTLDILEALLKKAEFRPLAPAVFEDHRTNRSQEEKCDSEWNDCLDTTLSSCFKSLSLEKKRLLRKDLLALPTGNGSLLPLSQVMAGPELHEFNEVIAGMMAGSKEDRIRVALALLSEAKREGYLDSLLEHRDAFGCSVLHMASLLLKGHTTRIPLTDKQLRSKRVKSYESIELELLSYLLDEGAANATCGLYLGSIGRSDWAPLHAAIRNANLDLIDTLLSLGRDNWASLRPMHFIASTARPVDSDVVKKLASACAQHEDCKALLNEAADESTGFSPLHVAVAYKNIDVIKALTEIHKTNINSVDNAGRTPVFLACENRDIETLRAFSVARDRIDLTLRDNQNTSCLEVCAVNGDVELIEELIKLRKNDVIELLISEVDQRMSLLKQLEQQNYALLRENGFVKDLNPETDPIAPADVYAGEPEVSDGIVSPAQLFSADHDNMPAEETETALPADLLRSKAVLEPLLRIVNESGVVDAHFHINEMYCSNSSGASQ